MLPAGPRSEPVRGDVGCASMSPMAGEHGGEGALGTYGLRIHGLDAAASAFQRVAEGSAELTVECRVSPAAAEDERPSELAGDGADLRLLGGGRLRMRRGADRVSFSLPEMPSVEDLVHPYLAPAAALAQLWQGHEAYHAGAFAVATGAVLVLGGKEDGKSTTLAWIARSHRLPVIADDLAVIVDGSVLAGPRCIDVRANSEIDPAALGGERVVRGEERRRVTLPPAPPALPVAAVVCLAWGERPALEHRPVAGRLPTLLAQRMFRAQVQPDPLAVLDLAGLPMLTLTRPRGERGLRDGVELLLAQVG
jgi:hypothetical protein